MNDLIFIDIEADPASGRVREFGAVRDDGCTLRTDSPGKFSEFIRGCGCLAGHNILDFDIKYIGDLAGAACPGAVIVDTLYLSPLLFPARPYHRLLKDDKLQTGELNNPVNDAQKCRDLYRDEENAFRKLPEELRQIYRSLLERNEAFSGFFSRMEIEGSGIPDAALPTAIRNAFRGRICEYAPLASFIRANAAELAYALALISAEDRYSITPPWVTRKFPGTGNVMRLLRGSLCGQPDCPWCAERLDARRRLKDFFGFDSFRTYEGVPLQEQAVRSAVAGESLLAVFPTGGGKSLTFQLPALIAGETERGLTVVISPLQSLMKDQVDHLEEKGIAEAVTINGLLDPIERRDAINRVANGMASILYISPESLRSSTIENILASRNVVRFVIDEAHCFSAWGQDFRVDYLYIGDFINRLRERKGLREQIPVSCFTATAKQKVISDIREYFSQKLGLQLKLFATDAARTNLHYAVLYKENEEEKYAETRNLIRAKNCPTIVYVSRVRRSKQLAERLRSDGFSAAPYNGKMDSAEKIRIQNGFLRDEIQIIVATSAFGMGVDKKDVGLVIHYDISDSLENYTQEAGRAGRDEKLNADCYVLFNDDDLDRHFILLNQTRLSISEIQQVWQAIKELTRHRGSVNSSALEIARQAGWDDTVTDIGTRVTTAIAALEDAGYVERGRNVPHIYASSITVPSVTAAAEIMESSSRMNDEQRTTARRVLGYLISRKNTGKSMSENAESRVDYLADRLGLSREEVVSSILLMREEGLLADQQDLTAVLHRTDTRNRSAQILKRFLALESFLIEHFQDGEAVNWREMNDLALRSGIQTSTLKDLKTIMLYWTASGQVIKSYHGDEELPLLLRTATPDEQRRSFDRRSAVCDFIVRYLFSGSRGLIKQEGEEMLVAFSVMELEKSFNREQEERLDGFTATGDEIQAALLYLSRIHALTIEGGFMVSYNSMQINRRERDNRIRYKQEDYRLLNEFYQQKMQQIHIVGEYAHLMVRNYDEALRFVRDYFQMDYRGFLSKYFRGNRLGEINRNITPEKYDRLFGELSPVQMSIINDDSALRLLVAAGPGSGKTRVLVHKLASLIMLEDVKHDQLLMLTFSRAAATEFKKRLIGLVGNAAHFVDIKTFHGFCFDLMGKIGNLPEAQHVVEEAVGMIRSGKIEPGRITKTVLVIDEAQDMDGNEYSLVCALAEKNEGMRIIAVGDDDQNIYGFRGSDPVYMGRLMEGEQCRRYEMTDNYRSDRSITAFTNAFVSGIRNRMKTSPVRSMSDEDGLVRLVRYSSSNLETSVAAGLKNDAFPGSTCVLTATNDEAARVVCLLNEAGIPASLIQSSDGFDLSCLQEIRFFMEETKAGRPSSVISSEEWNAARERLREEYSGSAALELSLRIIDTFAGVNRTIYRSDLEEYLHESRLEHFAAPSGESVTVSTMHRAKGREFDNVYLMLDRYDLSSDESKRAVYVAMTRARHRLLIHTSLRDFDHLSSLAGECVKDSGKHTEPETLLLTLTHRDVFLTAFYSLRNITENMRSGDRLLLREGALVTEKQPAAPAAFLSRSCLANLDRLGKKGYRFDRAQIRFIVYWRSEPDQPEVPVILPDIYLKKRDQ